MTSIRFHSQWTFIAVAMMGMAVTLSGCSKAQAKPDASNEFEGREHERGEGEKRDDVNDTVELTKEALIGAKLTFAKAERRDLPPSLEIPAEIVPIPDRRATLGPRVAGRVVEIQVNVGDEVKKGQTVVLLESYEVGRTRADLIAASALGGKQVGAILDGQKRFALRVRFPEGVRNDEASIARIPVLAGNGKLVPLGELVSIETRSEAAQISRERIQRRVTVELNVRGRDIASVVADAQSAVDAKVKLPPGYIIEWGGQFENLQRASKRLAVVVPLALLLIFVLLYGTFNASRQALLIFLNVPFAAVGGIFALSIRGMPLSISAGVGFIALFGVAVMNGVVLVSYIRKLEQERGLPPAEAAREAALVRMRPVLMTALVAALGFIPMALSTGSGAEVQRPLATVVIGGLVTATLLTLLVLPTIYVWFAGESSSETRG